MHKSKNIFWTIAIILYSFAACDTAKQSDVLDGKLWVTTADRTTLFQKVNEDFSFAEKNTDLPVIEVDTAQQFQSIDGFGYTLTGGSAYLIHEKLTTSKRKELLHELFSPDSTGIGVSYLRISVGASDLDDHVFSYNDLPPGQTDKSLAKLSLAEDKKYLIPVLKDIIAIYPDIKIMGSPWSAPAWMKTNNSPILHYIC